MISPNERILIEMVKRNSKERATAYLQDYIQRHGFLNNEVGDMVKKLLDEKANKPKAQSNIEQMIEEIESLPDTFYSDNIMDVTPVSWRHMKDKVIEIIRKYTN